MSVLIVDDTLSNIAMLRALIEREGMSRIHTETDSRNVLRCLSENRPDLVLLDLRMPHLDGHQVLRQIRQFAAANYLPVLVLTADTTSDARDRALSEGAQDFLTKPLDTTEAVLRIANLLETKQLYTDRRNAWMASADPEVPSEDGETTRSRIETVLRDASIVPVYQPVVDVSTMTVVGYEGLSRFPDADHGAPDKWFADALTVGLGVELEWQAASMMLATLETLPPDVFLAVNLSPAAILQLSDRELCPPRQCPSVVIEITEHVPVEDYAALHRAIERTRSNGARLAADDLGAGYAGFRHLINLEPDIVKLDISLTSGMHRSRSQRALASALVAFAADVGATVVGEGVELPEELEVLRAIGVPWAQGYHLGRPAGRPTSDGMTSS
jgi:EAL domain-containing protein (putative c-di-GMP-specific phosphodiesterase class I)/ActR/RegA family two-component response regulator